MTEEQFIDMMAAQAMHGLMSTEWGIEADKSRVAEESYAIADAMWKEKCRRITEQSDD